MVKKNNNSKLKNIEIGALRRNELLMIKIEDHGDGSYFVTDDLSSIDGITIISIKITKDKELNTFNAEITVSPPLKGKKVFYVPHIVNMDISIDDYKEEITNIFDGYPDDVKNKIENMLNDFLKMISH